MKRLILVAGPSCSGKTTFIACIFAGNLQLMQSLGITNLAEWVSLEAKQLDKIELSDIRNLVLHYDLVQQYDTATDYRYIPGIFADYDDIMIITLVASPFFLLARNTWRLLNSLLDVLFRPSDRTRGMYRKLSTQWRGMATSIYQDWLHYTEDFAITRQLIFDTSGITSISRNILNYTNLKLLPQHNSDFLLP